VADKEDVSRRPAIAADERHQGRLGRGGGVVLPEPFGPRTRVRRRHKVDRAGGSRDRRGRPWHRGAMRPICTVRMMGRVVLVCIALAALVLACAPEPRPPSPVAAFLAFSAILYRSSAARICHRGPTCSGSVWRPPSTRRNGRRHPPGRACPPRRTSGSRILDPGVSYRGTRTRCRGSRPRPLAYRPGALVAYFCLSSETLA